MKQPRGSPAAKHVSLFLAANPNHTRRLALDREARAIHVELKRSGYRDSHLLTGTALLAAALSTVLLLLEDECCVRQPKLAGRQQPTAVS